MAVHYSIEADFVHMSLRCIVVAQGMGFRCGYVGVPMGHPFYQKTSSTYIPELKNSLDRTIEIHGGITFSEFIPKYDNYLWWFGYDCAHAGDAYDLDLMSPDYRRIYSNSILTRDESAIRSKEYCIEECKKLAEQLLLLSG